MNINFMYKSLQGLQFSFNGQNLVGFVDFVNAYLSSPPAGLLKRRWGSLVGIVPNGSFVSRSGKIRG